MRALLCGLAALLFAAATCGPPAGDGNANGTDAAPATPDTAAGGQPPASGAEDPFAPDELLEAIFRYQFEHNASGLQQNAGAYCLSLGPDRPVPASLLKRFANQRPPVYGEPECPGGEGVLTFQVRSVKWLSEDEVEAIGGYHEGNLSSSTESFRVAREAGRWVVKESRLLVIS
ncbi:MAG TPA: hypothetical protein VNJ70_19380 [Thermoanaerobaculia bacterium]|nr:hypothetical protein [Thermoanaerobaculia bacterium]